MFQKKVLYNQLLAALIALSGLSCKKSFSDNTLVNTLLLLDMVKAASAPVSDTKAPSLPGGGSAKSAGSTQIDLSWTASTDNITPPAKLIYEICQSSVSGSCASFKTAHTSTAGAATFSANNLDPLTAYYFTIRAKDEAGNTGSAGAEFSATTAAGGTANSPVYTPGGGLYGTPQSVTLTTDIQGAVICYTTDGSTPVCNAAAASCTAGTAYTAPVNVSISQTIQGQTCRKGFTDSPVSVIAYTIDGADPSAVTGAAAAAAGSAQIDLSWTASTDDTTPAANLVYEICQALSAGTCDNFTTATYTSSAGAVLYSVTGLTGATTYYFRMRAVDQFTKKSGYSPEFSAKTAPVNTVATPSFTPAAGTYASAQTVTFGSATASAAFCYTTDGFTDPACGAAGSCTTGTSAASLAVSTDQTLRIIACLTGYAPSSVSSAAYKFDATPPGEVTLLSGVHTGVAGEVKLSWKNPWDADLGQIEITPPVGGVVTIASGAAGAVINQNVTGQADGTLGTFTVKTIDALGNKSAGVTVMAASSTQNPGAKTTVTAGGVTFNLSWVPPLVTNYGTADTISCTVSKGFFMGDTEVTWSLWNTVRLWAVTDAGGGLRADGGPLYTIPGAGQEGSSSATCGSSVVAANQPVSCISPADAIVWANAFTEWYNLNTGSSLTLVYYDGASNVVRSASQVDGTETPQALSTGFRLPVRCEWELAARYLSDANGDGDITDVGEFFPGTWSSGGSSSVISDPATVGFAATDPVAWFGGFQAFPVGNTVSTKPAATKTANKLGIFDMAGNLDEMVFRTGATKGIHGGNFTSPLNTDNTLQVGREAGVASGVSSGTTGLRILRN